nr:SART-1 family protein DOT2-like [Coffea arabica]XP_027070540.1 SART-1 family protein DOT2-like [Coffea arabica]XP_027070541.1 SART-1 family protein DOT2-like [Coffea arabica]
MTMDVEFSDSRRESVEVRDQDEPSTRERWVGGYDDMEEDDLDKSRESSKHRGREKSKSNRREDKDHRHKDRERSKTSHGSKDSGKESKDEKERVSGRDRRNEDREKPEKEKSHDKARERDIEKEKYRDKERDKDRKDRGKEKERERERDRELDRDAERGRDKERVKDKSRDKDKDREKEREKHREHGKERDADRDKSKNVVEKEKVKERTREKERDADQDKERQRDKDRASHKQRDEGHERSKDLRKEDKFRSDSVDNWDRDSEDGTIAVKDPQHADGGPHSSTTELELRIMKMKEERVNKKSEGASEVLSWVNRSRKIEDRKNSEREKALQLSKIFEEQDNMNEGESDDDNERQYNGRQNTAHDLGGVKVLHGLDKVLEGGAVVLTLKDQNILADGGVNEEVDLLENVEIGEQKRRDGAYKAAKKKTGIYDDKFNDETGSEKKILPQYDDQVTEEGIALDASGRISGEVEKKLEELRRRLQGGSKSNNAEDLNVSGKILSDYYTQEEMLQFKKPKKKKSLRKKEKLDIEALEAEAKSAGLGLGDLGSRKDGRRQALKEEQERNESEMRSSAYQSALAKAGEASKALRLGQTQTIVKEEDDTPVLGDDDEDLRKSLERARRLALKKQSVEASGPQAIALLASSSANDLAADRQNPASAEAQESKVVFTEMEEFVWGLQLDEEAQKTVAEDVFMEEDIAPNVPELEPEEEEDGGWSEVKEIRGEEIPEIKEEEVVPDAIIHEAAVGKGLSGALKLLKERGSLKETVEWGGRNMDKKKSKLVGIHDDEGPKEIHIERTDEYGRILTPKEAFRILSHKFHGKGPGKMKQEKRMRQYLEELKVKQMKNADTPSLSVERMREAQAQLKTPYLVLSGHVKPGQTSDPRSGFATVEKDLPGGLTPMLGDKKVEYFLGKRKPEPGDAAFQKKPRT